ncbi:MAG: hypothetical protein A2636_00655 [Elusimicrobia bacterium RIFCSPHIGHO2_01_FULL_64_10]|nr:MAG: hypothetical protein A2636_00655 [Elusimicrobia bacterium RIFCSPHIGHO2_01_FULL_64_10]
MNQETRVGLFVLLGLVVSGLGVMKLSDFSFQSRYTLTFVFDDVGNLREKSLVRMSGVEIGRVHSIDLSGGRARVRARIDGKVPVYENARVRVKLTGLIGNQFLDLTPGTAEARRLADGDTLEGRPTRNLNELMEKLGDLIEGKGGEPGLGDDLRATMKHLRSITGSLDQALGRKESQLTEIVDNLHQFSVDLKGVTADLREITSNRKGDVDASLAKLRSILDRVDDVVARIQKGEGSLGKLLSDKEMGEEVKNTVSNLKETSQSAKEVLARFTKMRSYWEFELRPVPDAGTVRGDAGIRLQPREGKYYYLGVNNAGDRKDEFKDERDYERKNTITALLGKEFGPVTLEAGAIRSKAGLGLRYNPFRGLAGEESPNRWARGVELNAQAFDFGRDERIGRAGRERRFRDPHYNVGLRYKVTRWMDLGAAVEDLAELQQVNLSTHLIFEDKDLAYLFGFVSFAR